MLGNNLRSKIKESNHLVSTLVCVKERTLQVRILTVEYMLFTAINKEGFHESVYAGVG